MKPDTAINFRYGLSLAFLVLMLVGFALHKNYGLHPDWLLVLILFASTLGILALALTIELIIGDSLRLWSVRFACATSGTVYFFFAKTWAIDEVNSIFGIDASALPLTVSAGVFLHLIYGIRWLFVAAICLSIWAFFSTDNGKAKFMYLCVGISSLIAVLFAFVTLSSDSRQNVLYRLAHQSDFSAKFMCQGIDPEKYRALLITPDQRRALIAPALPKQNGIFEDKNTPSLMIATRRPDTFPVVECKPSIDFQCWSSAWSDWNSRWRNPADSLTFERHMKMACGESDLSQKKISP